MTVSTKYEIGDKIIVGGYEKTIISVHLYLSEKKQTERYYLGDEQWLTLHIKDERVKNVR